MSYSLVDLVVRSGRMIGIAWASALQLLHSKFTDCRERFSSLSDSSVPERGALVDTLEQRLLFSAEHPLGLSFFASDEPVDAAQQADKSIVFDALDVLHNIQRDPSTIDQPLNDDTGVDDAFVVIYVTTDQDVDDAPDKSSYAAIMADPGADNFISLREAISVANSDPDVDVVRLGTDTYDLKYTLGDNKDDDNVEGDLDVSAPAGSQYIIQGEGPENTRIEQDVVDERVFEIVSGSVIITDLTIRSGDAVNTGGGLLALDATDVFLQNVTFEQNHSDEFGGAVYVEGSAVFDNVLFEENDATRGAGLFIVNGASFIGTDTTFYNNTALQYGAGIYVAGDLDLYDSVIEANHVDDPNDANNEYGGGVFVSAVGDALIANSVIESNYADVQGGGIYNSGILTVLDSTFKNNSAVFQGGALYNVNEAEITRTLIWGNFATGDVDSEGGGIFNESNGDLDLTYSIVGNNNSTTGGAGIHSVGSTTIANSLITLNIASTSSGTGGVHFAATDAKNLTLTNTVISDNTAEGNDSDIQSLAINEIVSQGFNLLENEDRVATTDTDILGIDPLFSNFLQVDHELFFDIDPDSAIINTGSSAGVGDITMAGTIVDATPNIGGVTTDFEGGLVFWASASGDIYRSSPSFTVNQRIVTTAGDSKDIDINSVLNRVYWLDDSSSSIRSAALDGSDIRDEQLVSSEAVGFAVDADDERFYVAEGGSSEAIVQYEVGGSPVNSTGETVITSTGTPTAIEYDDEGNTLYWSNEGANASIEQLNRQSADPDEWQNTALLLTDDPGFVEGPEDLELNITDDIVYWTEPSNFSVSVFDHNATPTTTAYGYSGANELLALVYNSQDAELLLADDDDEIFAVDSSVNVSSLATLPDSMEHAEFSEIIADEQVASYSQSTETTNTGMDILEGATQSLSGSLSYSDPDSRSDQIVFSHDIVTAPDVNISELTITLDTIPVDTFSQQDLDQDRVRITHSGSHTGTENDWTISMSFDVIDNNSGMTASSVFEVRVSNLNDAPLFTAFKPVPVTIGFSGEVGVEFFTATDEDTHDADISYTIPTSEPGVFQINGVDVASITQSELEAGSVTFRHTGSETQGTYPIEVRVSDGQLYSLESFDLELTPEPVSPTTGKAATFSVLEGANVLLDNLVLEIQDTDTPANGVMITVAAISEGHVEVDGTEKVAFTLEELDAGLVRFVHGDAENSSTASLDLLVDDGFYEVSVPTISFTVVAQNDNPPVAANHTLSGKHGSSFDSVDFLEASYAATSSLLHGVSDVDLPDDAFTVTSYTQPTRGSVSVSANGEFSYIVNSSEAVDQSFQDEFTYQISDDGSNVSTFATVQIQVVALEGPVYSGNLSDITINELDDLDHTFDQNAFTSAENATPFTWSIRNVGAGSPTWLSLDADTGNLYGTPTDAGTGTYDLRVSVFDTNGLQSDEASVIIVVNDINQSPQIERFDAVVLDENTTDIVVGEIIAFDPDGGDVLNLTSQDTRFEFEANELKLVSPHTVNFETEPEVSFKIFATDQSGTQAELDVAIEIADQNESPEQIATVPDQQIDAQSALSAMFNAFMDPDGDDLNFTLTLVDGSVLPSWLTFDEDNSVLQLGDTPSREVSAQLLLSADDGRGEVARLQFMITFVPEPELAQAQNQQETLRITDELSIVETNSEEESVFGAVTDGRFETNTVEEEPDGGYTEDLFSESINQFMESFGQHLLATSDENSLTTTVNRATAISDFLESQSKDQDFILESGITPADLFDGSVSLADMFSAVDGLDPEAFSAFSEEFEKQRELFQSDLSASRGIVVSSVSLGSGLSVGYILYLLRGGAIMTSMLSSLPAWRFVDPLPILSHMEETLTTDDESLQTLVADSVSAQ